MADIPIIGQSDPVKPTFEAPISPRENGELKTALEKRNKAEESLAVNGIRLVELLAISLNGYEELAKSFQVLKEAEERAIKSSGVRREQVQEIDTQRGMVVYTKK